MARQKYSIGRSGSKQSIMSITNKSPKIKTKYNVEQNRKGHKEKATDTNLTQRKK